jgi:hypothetical protein
MIMITQITKTDSGYNIIVDGQALFIPKATREEWEAKCQEIRDRFPYPEKATL